ncbi:hypothetical protein ZEAMMB73_Zm00001d005946 [Zea mays]|uniref:Uncharacterized protein n=1 Tax=Zea mays TaxID=4577 RepID=A0A1D6ERN4_MAIZE|nr:hypothetical protein ZEAMMB73_Zm00001d005946 [Zea mays]
MQCTSLLLTLPSCLRQSLRKLEWLRQVILKRSHGCNKYTHPDIVHKTITTWQTQVISTHRSQKSLSLGEASIHSLLNILAFLCSIFVLYLDSIKLFLSSNICWTMDAPEPFAFIHLFTRVVEDCLH